VTKLKSGDLGFQASRQNRRERRVRRELARILLLKGLLLSAECVLESHGLYRDTTNLKMNVYSPPSSTMGKIDKRKSNNYKALKESFVSNLSGGSVWEINEVSLVLPVSLVAIFHSSTLRC
jgi:hypothetical protein